VKAESREDLETARTHLLSQLHKKERDYLQSFYQPKEIQFCHAYTNTYVNLGVYSTQRNESYHVVVKKNLNKNLTVSAAVEALVERTSQLAEQYNERINKDRKNLPVIMDKRAFKIVKSLLTHYAIKLVNMEYIQAKELSDQIDRGEECLFVLDKAIGCTFGCQLPARFRLPCKHWIMQFYIRNQPLPVSLFHPRWLLDGPPVVYSWKIATSAPLPNTSPSPNRTHTRPSSFDIAIPRTKYANNGEQLIIDAATKAVQKLKSLPPGEKEGYASGFDQLALKLAWKQDEITSSRQAMPSELPEAIHKQDVLFKRNRRRGYTAREAAKEEEKNQRRHAKETVRQAESARAKERAWSEELKREHLARHTAARAVRAEAITLSALTPTPVLACVQPQEVIKISSESGEEEEYDM
jgi:hypothetical protein